MSKIKEKIIWEKWVDPYIQDFAETEWPDFVDTNEYDDPDDDEENKTAKIKKHTMYAISSPMGLIPFNEYSSPSKIFNFWVGHTNFDITQNLALLIEQASGVEILDIFTRYRFRIAIAKAFKDSEVMSTINSMIKIYFSTSK